jgi:hypothetical protein
MAVDLRTSDEPGVTQLVTGIVHDAQELIQQQLALFKHEVREDFRKTKEATLSLVIGGGIAAVGGILLCVMLAHLLNWAFPNHIALWGGYAIVGGALALIGGGLLLAGQRKFASFNPLPDETLEAMQENVKWITNQK